MLPNCSPEYTSIPIYQQYIRTLVFHCLLNISYIRSKKSATERMDSGDKCLDSITGSEYFIISYKGSITFKNCESLYYIPAIYIILYISNISVYKSAKKVLVAGGWLARLLKRLKEISNLKVTIPVPGIRHVGSAPQNGLICSSKRTKHSKDPCLYIQCWQQPVFHQTHTAQGWANRSSMTKEGPASPYSHTSGESYIQCGHSNPLLINGSDPQGWWWLQFSHSVMSDSLWPHGLQHARLPCPSPTPGACSNSCPSSHDAIQSSYPLSSPSPAFNLFQYQDLFQWVSPSHQVPKVLEHLSFQWIFNTDTDGDWWWLCWMLTLFFHAEKIPV